MTVTTRRIRLLAGACSVTVLACALPQSALAAEAAEMQSPDPPAEEEILVVGLRAILSMAPERDLDEEAIAGYDESTIDGLLGEIRAELGDGGTPLILVNGERANSLDEIGGLPVEAVQNIKVLPRGAAAGAGGKSTQRVVSISLKKSVRSATLLGAHKVATDGGWNAERAEAILTYIEGSKRLNVTFKVRDESALLESDRDIIQPHPRRPFAIGGNVVGLPDAGSEIDPSLSAIAGETVFVTPTPMQASPSLADFAAGANDPAITDLGRFRTLRPDTRNYDLNGTFATRLAPWLTGNVTLRYNRDQRGSARGLPPALFVVPASNSFTPFSNDIALALYGPGPLRTDARSERGEAALTLNGAFGRWTSHFNARLSRSKDVTRTERPGSPGTVTLADGVDPFNDDLFALVPFQTDRSAGRTTVSSAQLSLTGPALQLPAGDLLTTVEASFRDERLRSQSDSSGLTQKRSFHRSQRDLRGTAEIPLASEESVPILGELSASAELGVTDYSDAGTAYRQALGLSWEPVPRLRLYGELERSEEPAPIRSLGNPVVITSEARVFDPLTGQTVDVTQITGGNSDLSAEEIRTWRLSGQLMLIERHNLHLNAEYTDQEERNFVSFLPDASAAVMLAFPERFVRDSDGVLTSVDLRPVNFDRHREKWLRYGFSLNTNLGGGSAPALNARRAAQPHEAADEAPQAATGRGSTGKPFRLQVTANHTVVFKDEIRIRPGLDSVDLLEGGAIGIGGGRVRHQLDGSASLTKNGSGVRLTAVWRGPFTLQSRVGDVEDELRFSPVLAVGLRTFADVGRWIRHNAWAKNLRISAKVENLFNDRQEVRDSAGTTPLQYQPGYRDALGRTVEIELRKVF